MTITDRTTASRRARRGPDRRTALLAGLLYLLTFVSIPTLALYGPVHGPDYVLGPGPDSAVLIGVVLETIVALACIATAVVLHPVLKRVDETLSLGFVSARTLEAATIFVSTACLLTVVSLRESGIGQDGLVTAQALVSLRDWMFLTGQGFLPAVNALLLGSLMYRSRLVPRILPIIGLIGHPCSSPRLSPPPSTSGGRCPGWQRSRHCQSPCGSSPWASGWSSRGSAPHPIPETQGCSRVSHGSASRGRAAVRSAARRRRGGMRREVQAQ